MSSPRRHEGVSDVASCLALPIEEDRKVIPPHSIADRCSWNSVTLDRFVSGECDRADALDVERHVAFCGACSDFVDDRRRTRAALRSAVARDDGPPPELLFRVRDRLRESETSAGRHSRWQPYALAAGIVLAATCALSWMVAGSDLSGGGADSAAIRLAADAEHHARCVGEMIDRVPVAPEASAARDPEVARVEAIVRDQVLGGMTITDSHRCTDGQRRFVHVIVERESARAGVLVSDVQPVGENGLPVVATAHTATFSAGSRIVSVVSNSPEIDASVLAERLRPSMSEQLTAAVLRRPAST